MGFRNDLENKNVVMMKMHPNRENTEHARSIASKSLYCFWVMSEVNILRPGYCSKLGDQGVAVLMSIEQNDLKAHAQISHSSSRATNVYGLQSCMTLAKNQTIIACTGQVDIARVGCRASGSKPPWKKDFSMAAAENHARCSATKTTQYKSTREERDPSTPFEVHCQFTAEMDH